MDEILKTLESQQAQIIIKQTLAPYIEEEVRKVKSNCDRRLLDLLEKENISMIIEKKIDNYIKTDHGQQTLFRIIDNYFKERTKIASYLIWIILFIGGSTLSVNLYNGNFLKNIIKKEVINNVHQEY